MRHNTDDAFDENGLLRDGARYRVPMQMRDARDQRTGRKHKYDPRGRLIETSEWEEETDDAMVLHDGFGRPVGHRPGHAVPISDTMRDAKAKAYADYTRDLTNAWRDQPTGARQGENDSVADAKAKAYADYDRELCEAWRKP